MSQIQRVQRNTIIPLLTIAADWLIIAGSIAVSLYAQNLAVTALAIIVIGSRQHALFIMVHEATHMNISGNRLLNDWVSDLFCALPLLFDTGVYRKNHLQHHRALNTDQDPDWMRKQGRRDWRFPMTAKQLWFYIPAYVLAIGPAEILMVFWGFSGFGQKERWKTQPVYLLFKLAYFSTAVFTLVHMGVWREALVFWAMPMLFVLPFVTRVRNLAEHFAVTYEDENNSTREVAGGWLETFLLTPHNVNYHLTHHTYPHIPFYRIRAVHAELRRSGAYDGAQINGSYFVPFKGSVLHDVIHGPRKKPMAVAAPAEISRRKAA